jgi:peptidase A4-like protein
MLQVRFNQRGGLIVTALGLVVALCTAVLTTPSAANAAVNSKPPPNGASHAGLTSGPSRPLAVPASITNYTSQNWAGYFTTNAAHTTDFKSVHARWVVPPATCPASGEAWVVSWVGMDGWWNNIVEQGGSSTYCNGGVAQYNLWWEMWPHNLIQLANTINPGDTIDATVSYVSSTATFSIVVKDLTNSQTLSQSQPCYSDMGGCPRVNAEVITESPFTTGGTVFALPHYGTTSYSSITVTDTSGHTGVLTDSRWSLGHVNQVDPSTGITKQTTSAIGTGGNTFSTSWVHS